MRLQDFQIYVIALSQLKAKQKTMRDRMNRRLKAPAS